MPFLSTKTFGHELGLSVAFRQYRARSHCRFIHGYALAVRLEFEARYLDDKGWVVDFGALKDVKKFLEDHFDHKLVVAKDDPELVTLMALHTVGLANVVVLEHGVGCEAFAAHIFHHVQNVWLPANVSNPPGRVRLISCEVREHGANSAIYRPD